MENRKMNQSGGLEYKSVADATLSGAMYVTVNGSSSMYYVNTDHLGSIDLVYKEGNNTAPYAEQSFDAWGRYRNPANWQTFQPTNLPNYPNWLIRGYTGHEHHKEFELINMNGRMYDPVLGRMLSPDNYVQSAGNTQNFNRYSYCWNNPLKYTDPDGNFVWLIPAVVGGVINVATNWNNIDNVWQGLGYFGSGAVSGGLAVLGPAGWAAGGAITGAANAALGGASGSQVLQGGIVGAFSGLVGGVAGQWAGQNLGGVVINGFNISAKSAIGGAITGAIGGAAGGYAGGFTAGYMMTGNLSEAHQAGVSGLTTGAAIGGGVGAAYGYYSAKEAGRNPWTGRPNKSVTVGENMSGRVNPAAENLGSETISNDWDARFGDTKPTRQQGSEFNREWFRGKIEEGYIIYDMGPEGTTPTRYNYNMELNMMHNLAIPGQTQYVIIHYKVLTIYK